MFGCCPSTARRCGTCSAAAGVLSSQVLYAAHRPHFSLPAVSHQSYSIAPYPRYVRLPRCTLPSAPRFDRRNGLAEHSQQRLPAFDALFRVVAVSDRLLRAFLRVSDEDNQPPSLHHILTTTFAVTNKPLTTTHVTVNLQVSLPHLHCDRVCASLPPLFSARARDRVRQQHQPDVTLAAHQLALLRKLINTHLERETDICAHQEQQQINSSANMPKDAGTRSAKGKAASSDPEPKGKGTKAKRANQKSESMPLCYFYRASLNLPISRPKAWSVRLHVLRQRHPRYCP